MPINSKKKGSRGELKLVHKLKEFGIKARRGQQFKGTPDSPDIIVEDYEEWHIECKCVEKLNLQNAYEQAVKDKGDNQIPLVIHKKNRKPWMVTMSLDDFLKEFVDDL